MSEGDSSNGALLFYVFDGLITLRALYGFVKSYFMARLESQKRNDLGLASGSENGEAEGPGKALVRVYMDGCFDMMHFGHANALRQAKMLGDVLVVGINSDEEIRMHKGPPVMNDKERFIAVEAVKWVDEIIENAPTVKTSMQRRSAPVDSGALSERKGLAPPILWVACYSALERIISTGLRDQTGITKRELSVNNAMALRLAGYRHFYPRRVA
mmetsp:Transcript_9814/g.19992  ORF Transcript_9814/g.19992 Transcript_9814/m.19992 type:complete len:214 (-) Transcript_9814:904-1545(-)